MSPQKIMLVPPSPKRKYTFVLGRKYGWTLWRSLRRFRDEDLFFLFFFCLYPWICWHETRSAFQNPVVTSPPPRQGLCPRSKILPQQQATGPEPCCPIRKEDFFWPSPTNVRVKLFYASQILFVPPSLPGHATQAPRQAVRLINLACLLQEDKINHWKHRALALKNT